MRSAPLTSVCVCVFPFFQFWQRKRRYFLTLTTLTEARPEIPLYITTSSAYQAPTTHGAPEKKHSHKISSFPSHAN